MSSDDQHPDLVDLLAGELRNADVLEVGSHLEVCGSCREELAQLAVGHALLARSARTLDSAEPEAPLPPLSLPRTRPNRALLVAAAAAAVVGLVAGGVATSAFTDRSTSPPPTSQPSALVAARLTPVGGEDPAVRGQVEMYRAEAGHTRMEIRTSELPSAGAGRFYYAWLLDPVTQKMLPLGQVGPDGGTFDVADTALASYAAVDISLEDDDGDPAHSVTSVLRGSY